MRARARTHTHTHTHHCCCMICLFACLDSFDYTFVERRKCGTNLQRRDKIKSVEQLSRGGSNSTGNLVPWSRRNKSPERGSNSLGNTCVCSQGIRLLLFKLYITVTNQINIILQGYRLEQPRQFSSK